MRRVRAYSNRSLGAYRALAILPNTHTGVRDADCNRRGRAAGDAGGKHGAAEAAGRGQARYPVQFKVY